MKLQYIFWLILLFACHVSSYSYKQFKQRDTKLDTLSSLSQLNNLTQNDFSMQNNQEDEDYVDEDLKSSTLKPTPGSKQMDEEELEDEIIEDEVVSTTRTTSKSHLVSTVTITTTTSPANDVVYDNDENDENGGDYDDNQTSDDENTANEAKIDPYNCPSLCRCKFTKIDLKTNKPEEENEYEEDNEDTEKRKRQLNEEQDIQNNKYRIEVDCSSASLTSLRNLFEDEFPLDQIVSL